MLVGSKVLHRLLCIRLGKAQIFSKPVLGREIALGLLVIDIIDIIVDIIDIIKAISSTGLGILLLFS